MSARNKINNLGGADNIGDHRREWCLLISMSRLLVIVCCGTDPSDDDGYDSMIFFSCCANFLRDLSWRR